MLSTRLVQTHQFLAFERPDLNKIQAEQLYIKDSSLIVVDALVIGSGTEFGRSTTGKSGFLSATKIQTAHAKKEAVAGIKRVYGSHDKGCKRGQCDCEARGELR